MTSFTARVLRHSNGVVTPAAEVIEDDCGRGVRAAAASVTLILSGILLISTLIGVGTVRGIAALLLVFFGLGSAPLQFVRRIGFGAFCLLTPAIGLTTVVLVSFVSMEVQVWSPIGAGIVLAGAANAGSAVALRRLYTDLHPIPVRTLLAVAIISVAQRVRTRWSLSAACTAAGTAVWLASALVRQHRIPGIGGLLVTVFPSWYLGVALLVAGFVLADPGTEAESATPVISLMLALTVTPALLYGLPRSTTAAKHVGVVALFLSRHRVNPSIDIYNAWPGFFSAVAYMCRLGGINDPMIVATWWPALIGMCRLVAVRAIAARFIDRRSVAWLATALAILVDTVGQDYFSPQSLAFFLCLVLFFLAFRPGSETRQRRC